MPFRFLALALASTAFGGSIVINGDFETGDFTGWTTSVIDTGPAWYINLTPHTGSYAAATACVGNSCIYGTTAQQAALWQTLPTITGDSYTLSFWYNPGYAGSSGQVEELLVQWGGTGVIDLVQFGSGGGATQGLQAQALQLTPTTPGIGYNQYIVTGLTATSTSTVLNFLGRQDPSVDNLDDIIVTDTTGTVPEPASYLLAAAGLLALGAAKFRTRGA